MYTEFGFAKT